MPVRIAIIGGGVAGYPAAIRAARLGAKVALIEKTQLGGVCLHEGCIPTNILLQSAELYQKAKNAFHFGVTTENTNINMGKVIQRKVGLIEKLENGIRTLLETRKIDVFYDEAKVLSPQKVSLQKNKKILDVDRIIIATGATSSMLPDSVVSPGDVMSCNDILSMKDLPGEILIVGGGVVGIEFAQYLSMVGKKVTVLEMMPDILLSFDRELVMGLSSALVEENKIQLITGAKVSKVERKENKKVVTYTKDGGACQIEVDAVLVTTGRIPATVGIGIEDVGVYYDEKGIRVNKQMETNITGIYAAGDVTGDIMLAHVATAEGECAAKNALGHRLNMSYKAVPRCIYTSPEIASVGLTENEALKSHDIEVGIYPFYANSTALIMEETAGMVKIIADKQHGEILGAHILGPQATNLVAELTLAINMEATVDELADTIHPHPTLSESIMEAAMNVNQGAIHMP